MDSLQQSKEKKVLGTARSCFYVVASAEYSRCEGYAMYLMGPSSWRPHFANLVKTYLAALKWEILPHPPYSPDIAPSDYHLFRSMAYGLADQQLRSYEDK